MVLVTMRMSFRLAAKAVRIAATPVRPGRAGVDDVAAGRGAGRVVAFGSAKTTAAATVTIAPAPAIISFGRRRARTASSADSVKRRSAASSTD